jgi:hypothetical protein
MGMSNDFTPEERFRVGFVIVLGIFFIYLAYCIFCFFSNSSRIVDELKTINKHLQVISENEEG